jgi:hypothetical protein
MSKILLVGCFIGETEATSITVKSFFQNIAWNNLLYFLHINKSYYIKMMLLCNN